MKLFCVFDADGDIVEIYQKRENAENAVEKWNSSKYVSDGWKRYVKEVETDD